MKLQLTVRNVHIRFEDRAANPSRAFTVGFVLDEFSVVTTDKSRAVVFVDNSSSRSSSTSAKKARSSLDQASYISVF